MDKAMSCLVRLVFVDGIPYVQGCRLRILGSGKEVNIDGDSSIGSMTLDELFEVCYKDGVSDGSL